MDIVFRGRLFIPSRRKSNKILHFCLQSWFATFVHFIFGSFNQTNFSTYIYICILKIYSYIYTYRVYSFFFFCCFAIFSTTRLTLFDPKVLINDFFFFFTFLLTSPFARHLFALSFKPIYTVSPLLLVSPNIKRNISICICEKKKNLQLSLIYF